MGLSTALRPFRSLGLLALLAIAACAGGDRLDAPTRVAQGLGTPHWASGATVTVTQRSAVRVALTWPEAFDAEAPYSYAIYRDDELTHVVPAPEVLDGTVAASTTYVYAIAARDAEGRESDVSERLTVTVTTPGPSPAPEWPSGAALTVTRIGRNRAELAWPAGLPVAAAGGAYDACQYKVQHREAGTSDWTSYYVETEHALVTGLTPATDYEFQVLLFDLENQAAATGIATASATTASETAAFAWPTGAAATATVITRSSLRLTWTEGPLDTEFYEVERDLGAGFVPWGTVPATFLAARVFEGAGFFPRTTGFALRVRAVDSLNAATAWLDASAAITVPPTPAPSPLPRNETASLAEGTAFLYEASGGAIPQQTGVAPGTIVDTRAVVLVGRVQRHDGATLVAAPGVRVTVLGHPEFGETWSRADGRYEMAANGGSSLVVEFRSAGHIGVQRTVATHWGEYAYVDDVTLTEEATPVVLALDSSGEVPDGGVGLLGPVVNAATEPRRAAIFLPEGRTVTACLPGSTVDTCIPQALTGDLHVSLTEFTAADNDLASMPGTLPPSSGYTYAVSYTVREAEDRHATRVEFNGPVAAYVDNFMGLHFDGLTNRSGYAVPMGWYDSASGRWVANEPAAGWNDEGSGRAIEVLGVLADGRASLDVTGDGTADEPPGLGLSDDERRWIAATYIPGSALPRTPSTPHALWRVPIAHFTAWDANMNVRPEDGAKLPSLYKLRMLQVWQPCVTCGSVIENENRAVGERVDLPAVGASLHYHSGRSPSWRTQVIIPLTLEYAEADPPSPRPLFVVVHVFIEGKMYQHVLPPDPATGRVPAGESWTFERCASDTPPEGAECWDGRDVLGHEVRGSVPMRVAVGYLFGSVYGRTDAFGYSMGMRMTVIDNIGPGGGGSIFAPGIPRPTDRQSLILWSEVRTHFEQWDARSQGLGGWTLPMQHAWDANGERVLLGGGGSFATSASQGSGYARRLAGLERLEAWAADSPVLDGTLAVAAGHGNSTVASELFNPSAIAMDARAQLFIANAGGRIWRIDDNGRLRNVTSLVSGTNVRSMTFGADGALYVAEGGRVWRWQGGTLTHFAGAGGTVATGVVRRAAAISSPIGAIGGLAAAPDGAIYLTEPAYGRVRRIGPDGTIDTYAGDGTQTVDCTHEGGAADVDDVPALGTWLCQPTGVAVGPGGVVYLTEHFAVSRITPDGRLHRLAGRRHTGTIARDCVNEFPDHGMDARNACLFAPADVAVTPDGTALVAMAHPDGEYTGGFQNAVFGVDPDGRLIHVGAGGAFVGSGGQLTRRIGEGWLQHARDILVDGQGRPIVLSSGSRTVWRLEGDAPDRVPTANATITSPDGSERYTFTRSGRILDTTDARTGRTRYTFAYDAARRLHQVTDAFTNTLTIDYAAADASYIPSGVATSFTLTGPHGATATGSIGTNGWLVSVDAGEWGTTSLVYDAFRSPLTAMQDNLGRWHRYVHDETGRLDYDAWASSATTDLTGGRKVSLATTSAVRDPAGLHWTSRTRDGASLTSGLDRVDTASLREDGHEERTSTPPIGPGTTRATLRGTTTSNLQLWGTLRPVAVTGSVGTGANGLFWSRSYGGAYTDTVTPLDGQTRTDLRLGAATGSPLRLSVVTTRRVDHATRSDLWRMDAIDETSAVVPGAENETALDSMGAVPLFHLGVPRIWSRHSDRMVDRWDTTLGWHVYDRSPHNRTTYTLLDVFGRPVVMQAPQIAQPGGTLTLAEVTVLYDTRGRLQRVAQGTRWVQYAYSDDPEEFPVAVRGRLRSITRGTTGGEVVEPIVTTFSYNQDGARRVRVTAPGGIVTNSGVDPAGNVTSIVPPGRTEHAFSHGWRNMPAAYTPPIPTGGGAASAWQTTQEHEVQGMPHQVTRPDGVVDYAYTSGRLATVTLPAPAGGGARPTLTLAYDEATGGGSGTGVLTSVTHSVNGSLTYGHDFPATGTLPTSETWGVTEGGVTTTRAVSVGYNSLAQVASWTAEGGPTVAVTRDADDLVTGVGGLTITRDGPSGVELGTTMTVGESSVTTTQRYSAPYGEVASRGSTYGGGDGLSFAYGYDWFGRLEHVTESGEGSDGERWYRYDAAGRLARVCTTQDCGEGADGGVSTELEHYSYDANGTRTAWRNSLGSFTVDAADVDAQDRLARFTLDDDSGSVTFTYDNAGRTLTKVRRAEDDVAWSTTALVYDSDGALKSFTRTGDGAASVAYRNDAAGRRIARVVGGTVTARWTYQGIHPVAEYDAAWALKRVYVYATRGHVPDYVAQADGSGGWGLYRVVTDHLGSVRRVVRVSDGEVMQRMRYDAYGRVLQDETPDIGGVPTGWERIPFGYAGGLFDRTTGLVRFGARDYDAEIGRWTAKDPIGFNGGDGNLYGYCLADPINRLDPQGTNDTWLGDLWRSPPNVAGWLLFKLTSNASVVLTASSNELGAPIDFSVPIPTASYSASGAVHVDNMWLIAPFTPAVTIGRYVFYAPGQHTERREEHELTHIPQARLLGPFYLPAHVVAQGISGGLSVVCGHPHTDRWHEWNPIEWGPMSEPSVPWRFSRPAHW